MARMSAQERREELLAAALRVMTRDGLPAATVRAIVAEAGMHVASFHYCFDSKDQLLREVMSTRTATSRQATLSALRPGMDADTALAEGFRAYWVDVEADPAAHQLTYELTQYVLRTPGLESLAREQYEQYYAVARDFLQAVEESAQVEWSIPPSVLARMIVTVLDGLTLNWLVDEDSQLARASLDEFASALAGLARPTHGDGRGRASWGARLTGFAPRSEA